MRNIKKPFLNPKKSAAICTPTPGGLFRHLFILACLTWSGSLLAQFSDIPLIDRDETHKIQVQGPATISCTISISATPDPTSPFYPFIEGGAGFIVEMEGYTRTVAGYEGNGPANPSNSTSFEVGPGLQTVRFWLETFGSDPVSGLVSNIVVTPLAADPDLSDGLDTVIPAYGSAWQKTAAVSRDGTDSVCIQSDNADYWNDKAFWIETPGPGTLKFWYRADADNGQELHVRDDADSGWFILPAATTQWVQGSVTLTGSGPQSVSFGYAGASDGAPNYDGIPGAMYIDQLEFDPAPVVQPPPSSNTPAADSSAPEKAALETKITKTKKLLKKAKKKKKKSLIKRLKKKLKRFQQSLSRL